MLQWLLAMAVGAVLAYFLDRDRGRGRRNTAVDRAGAALRRGGSRLVKWRRTVVDRQATVLGQRMAPSQIEGVEPPNDATLAQKVETEVFGEFQPLKGRLNINAERGVIVLRGEVDSQDHIAAIEAAARAVAGVQDVRNLLHLPGTPAPGASTPAS